MAYKMVEIRDDEFCEEKIDSTNHDENKTS